MMILSKAASLKEFIKNGGFSFIFCIISVIVLPLHVEFLPPVMITWVLFWVLENYRGFNKTWDRKESSSLLFTGFTLYFLWYMAGLIYSNDIDNGILLIFRRISFVVFPLILFFPGDLIKRKVKLLLKIFSLSTLCYVLFCFGLALIRSVYFLDGNVVFNPHPPEYSYENYFFGTDLAFSQHPTYLTIYILLSVFIAFESFFDILLKTSIRILWLLSGIILLISLYFFSSRAGIISALILIPSYIVIRFRKIKFWWISIPVVVIASLLLISSFLNNDRLKYYFSDHSGTSFTQKMMSDNRIPIWKSAIYVIKNNFVIGVGVGDASEEIKKAYVSAGNTEMYYDNLNAHNQYLEVFLASGLIGFLIFISILSYMVYLSITRRNLLLGLFILIVMIYFLSESILNRIAGATLFSLFSFLLLNLDESNTQINNL